MKNKTFKKFICILISMIMVLSLPLSAVAVQLNAVPVIYVGGMSDNALYKNPNKNGSEVVFDINSSEFTGNITRILSGFLLGDTTQGITPVISGIKGIMDPILCAPNGKSLSSDVSNWQYDSPVSEYKADSVYTDSIESVVNAAAPYVSEDEIFVFSYDWRLDPIENADYLYDFIDHVKSLTSSRKVSLLAVGTGGVVVNSYLHEHEEHAQMSIASCVFFNTSLLGNALIGDFMKGRIARLSSDSDSIFDAIKDITGEHRGNAFMDFISEDSLEIISGVTENLLGEGSLQQLIGVLFWEIFEMIAKGEDLHKNIGKGYNNFALSSSTDAVFDDFLKEYLRNMPGLWALVPEKDFEEAMDFLFEDEIINSQLSMTIAKYRTVLSDTPATLNSAKNDGINVCVVAGYGLQILPVTISLDDNSDSIESTKYASAGAVTADNSTQSGHHMYCLNSEHNHRSSDGGIDASYCALPESTWFINGLPHGDLTNEAVAEFVVWLLFGFSQRSIRSNPAYPQYLKYNRYGKLSADAVEDNSNIKYGDVDMDNDIDAADARLALRISVELETVTKEVKTIADVDGIPGVSAGDARLILRYSVGLADAFPV